MVCLEDQSLPTHRLKAFLLLVHQVLEPVIQPLEEQDYLAQQLRQIQHSLLLEVSSAQRLQLSLPLRLASVLQHLQVVVVASSVLQLSLLLEVPQVAYSALSLPTQLQALLPRTRLQEEVAFLVLSSPSQRLDYSVLRLPLLRQHQEQVVVFLGHQKLLQLVLEACLALHLHLHLLEASLVPLLLQHLPAVVACLAQPLHNLLLEAVVYLVRLLSQLLHLLAVCLEPLRVQHSPNPRGDCLELSLNSRRPSNSTQRPSIRAKIHMEFLYLAKCLRA